MTNINNIDVNDKENRINIPSDNPKQVKNNIILKNGFRKFYFKEFPKKIIDIENISKREFGFMSFDNVMQRHQSFSSLGRLQAYLIKEIPSDVYCSNSFYNFPTFPMQDKQWLGADLIFDIDLKDLHLPCDKSHSYHICKKCKNISSIEINSCIMCNDTRFSKITFPCKICISSLKKEVEKLLDFLIVDFGIDKNSIHVFFSGNTGFHLHVNVQSLRELYSQSRADLSSYILGKELMPEFFGIRKQKDTFTVKIPYFGIDYGWRKRTFEKLGIDTVTKQRMSFLTNKLGGYYGFRTKLSEIGNELGARIDPMVTMDIHRIFRMPYSINSKSGLIKTRCDNLDTFEPFNDSCLEDDSMIDIMINYPIKFRLKNKSYNFDKTRKNVPFYLACYLVCKGFADFL
ncbi:MAG: DNA primase [Nitrososphaeraceae archaeon]|nr:DNA primase [Nitrososphaeraceae archaeon]